jgi:hypothetical protein
MTSSPTPTPLRRSRLYPACSQVAPPNRRVQARIGVDQGRPAAPAHPARDAALARPLQETRSRRARVRQAQERMGARAAPSGAHRARPATRRPDDPRQAVVRSRQSASRANRGRSASAPLDEEEAQGQQRHQYDDANRDLAGRGGEDQARHDQREKRAIRNMAANARTATTAAPGIAWLARTRAAISMANATTCPPAERRSMSPSLLAWSFASRFARPS